jgi:hypothetical protein
MSSVERWFMAKTRPTPRASRPGSQVSFATVVSMRPPKSHTMVRP